MSGTMLQMISVTTTAMIAYIVAQLLKSGPIYESLYDNMFQKDIGKLHDDYTMQYFLVPGDANYTNVPLKSLHIPHHPIIASVQREDITFTPNADTTLEGATNSSSSAKSDTWKLWPNFSEIQNETTLSPFSPFCSL